MWKCPALVAALLSVTLAASPAFAGATPWQEIAPAVKARLISSDHLDDGRLLAGLELQLPPGTKTYWRIPGETGIPTTLDFSASTGLSDAAIHWPMPEIDTADGYLDYVYRGAVVLPVELTPSGSDGTLTMSLMLGVCSDMCIPASATLSLPVAFDTLDAAEDIRLRQALAETPIAWDRPQPAFGSASIDADGTLRLTAPDPAIDAATLIVDAGDPGLLYAAPQKSRDGAVWTLEPLGGAVAGEREGRSLTLIFGTASGPYSVTLAATPAP